MSKKESFDPELFISSSLRFGIYLSASFIGFGLILYFIYGSGYPARTFPYTVTGVWEGLIRLKPAAIMSFGLLLLIATPIFRVAASTVIFLKERDYLYAVLTFLVFIILIFSLALGKAI